MCLCESSPLIHCVWLTSSAHITHRVGLNHFTALVSINILQESIKKSLQFSVNLSNLNKKNMKCVRFFVFFNIFTPLFLQYIRSLILLFTMQLQHTPEYTSIKVNLFEGHMPTEKRDNRTHMHIQSRWEYFHYVQICCQRRVSKRIRLRRRIFTCTTSTYAHCWLSVRVTRDTRLWVYDLISNDKHIQVDIIMSKLCVMIRFAFVRNRTCYTE